MVVLCVREMKMLKQTVNLYRAFKAPKPAENFLTWKRYRMLIIAFFAWFILLAVISLVKILSLDHEKSALLTQISQLQKEFLKIKATYPQVFFNEDASKVIEKLQLDVDTKAKILREISHNLPFSQILIGLAQEIVPNVWLTQIEITKSGKQIALKGNSIDTDNLQKFINNLLKNKLFSTYNINVTNVEKSTEKDNSQISFELNLQGKQHE